MYNKINVNMSYPRSRNRRTSTPYLKVCLCWKVYFRGLTIKDTQVGLHCSGTCLSLFQCCFVMIFRWNCPSSRPTLKGTEKRRSSTTCERYSFNWPNVMDCRFHSFSLGWGGGWRWREGHAPSHLGSKRVLVTFYFPWHMGSHLNYIRHWKKNWNRTLCELSKKREEKEKSHKYKHCHIKKGFYSTVVCEL